MWLLLAIPIIGIITLLSLLLGRIEPKKMQKIAKNVSVGISTLMIGYGLTILFLFIGVFWFVSDYPIERKQINEQYYFTQQEYGWAGSMPGKHIYIYKNRSWWFDKEVGYINKYLETKDVDVELLPLEDHQIKLSLFSAKVLEMDTVVDLETQYLKIDQNYWSK